MAATDSVGITAGYDVTARLVGAAGIGRYIEQLGGALERAGVELRRYAVGRLAHPLVDGRHLGIPLRLAHGLWRHVAWPKVDRLVPDADLVHATSFGPPATRLPVVVTVFDLAALSHPGLHPPSAVRQATALVRDLHRARVVLCISETTASKLETRGVARERLIVTPLAPARLAPGDEPIVDGPYLLAVGEQHPRKNLGTLLSGFADSQLAEVRIVHAGPDGADSNRVRARAGAADICNRVLWLGHVSDTALATLYRDALALCLPSIDEGFGLPVLEAMSAGTPVVVSDIPVMREVTGGNALFVPATDVRAWTEALSTIVGDESLRSRLGPAGRRWAAHFTYERTAELTLTGYRLALAS